MIAYFAGLNRARLVLWCYLAWYFAIVARYFEPSPWPWISSVGISVLIGLALNLATQDPGKRNSGWVIFRLFLIPFCVSSYSALIKGKGFILLFPPDATNLLAGVGACLTVLIFHRVCRWLVFRRSLAGPTDSAIPGTKLSR